MLLCYEALRAYLSKRRKKSGYKLAWRTEKGRILPGVDLKETHPVNRLYGSLSLPRPVDALVDEMRGPRPKR